MRRQKLEGKRKARGVEDRGAEKSEWKEGREGDIDSVRKRDRKVPRAKQRKKERTEGKRERKRCTFDSG